MRYAKLILVILLFLVICFEYCIALDERILTAQTDVKWLGGWLNQKEFYYCAGKNYYIYNLEKDIFSSTQLDKEWVGNHALKIRFEGEYISLNQKGIIKEVKLPINDEFIDIERVNISLSGRFITLLGMSDFVDCFNVIIYDVKTNRFIDVPFEKNEFTFGTSAYSQEERYLAIDIKNVKNEKGFIEINIAGVMVYDLIENKILKRHLVPSQSSYEVINFRGDKVVMLNDMDYLCQYDTLKNLNKIIINDNSYINCLVGPENEIYFVKNGKLVSVSGLIK